MYKPTHLVVKDLISHQHTEYAFRNGQAIIVVGQNLDDANQKGNGSGKSAIIEAIAIAITGDSIRNASVKDLIREGCKEAEVELTLHNSLLACELKISRKLSLTKSSQVVIHRNNEQLVYSDVNEYLSLIHI